MSLIRPPDEEARLIALGAFFAAEHMIVEQVYRVAQERDAAMGEVARLNQMITEMQPAPPGEEPVEQPAEPIDAEVVPDEAETGDQRFCHTHQTQRWACAPLATEQEPCRSYVPYPGEDCTAPDPHWHDDLNTIHPGLVPSPSDPDPT